MSLLAETATLAVAARHADSCESERDVHGTLPYGPDDKLTGGGEWQAVRLGAALGNLILRHELSLRHLNVLFHVPDIYQCRQTAELAAISVAEVLAEQVRTDGKPRPAEIDVVVQPRLAGIDLGPINNLTYNEMEDRDPRFMAAYWDWQRGLRAEPLSPCGGERVRDFWKRVGDEVRPALVRGRGGMVAFVAGQSALHPLTQTIQDLCIGDTAAYRRFPFVSAAHGAYHAWRVDQTVTALTDGFVVPPAGETPTFLRAINGKFHLND